MKRFLLILLVIVGGLQTRAQLIINEFMQSNIDCIMDDINEFPDSWVELYNNGTTAVNLGQYKLGISDNAAEAWALPFLTLDPKKHVIIYCDKVGNEASSGLHTDFRLESGKGCCVYLFQSGAVIDKVTDLKKQPAPNIAYGRKTDGSSEWGYQITPTPGASNCGNVVDIKKILGEPVFSQKGKVMSAGESITLTLSLPTDAPSGTVIRYTTDGTEPTATSSIYSNPLNIVSNRVVRAKLFCNGYLSPRSTVHSYIFFPTDRPLTLPVISIVTNRLYLYDSKIGIYTDSKTNGQENYKYDWRRPINFEYFEGQNTSSILNQLCETRIMGGATRSNVRKSLAIYANKRFGVKRFKYEFFPDQKPGLDDFKSLALRNAGNDFDYLYQRDAIIQRTMASHVDLDWQAWRPAIVYINGEYTGMLNIRERSNEDHIYTNYDGLEDIDMFENWSELKEGTWDNYTAFKGFYNQHNHTLAEYAEWMDWEEFFNLMIMNLYYCNLDFPGNNIVMWRPRTANGKWRWIAKDTDFGLGLYDRDVNYNTIEWLYNPNYDYNNNWANQYDHTRLFRRMMEDPDLKREFLDRCAIYMGDFLNERGTRAVWDPMYDIIKTEYYFHRKLINEWWPNYSSELSKARTWLSKRTDIFYKHVANYYSLGTPTRLTINQGVASAFLQKVSITFNGIKLSEGTFDGKFYRDRKITLKGTPVNGKRVSGWTIRQIAANGSITDTEVEGEEYTFNMPECSMLSINAVITDATAITGVTRTVSDDDNYYTLDGRKLTAKPTRQGIYIHQGQKIVIR